MHYYSLGYHTKQEGSWFITIAHCEKITEEEFKKHVKEAKGTYGGGYPDPEDLLEYLKNKFGYQELDHESILNIWDDL